MREEGQKGQTWEEEQVEGGVEWVPAQRGEEYDREGDKHWIKYQKPGEYGADDATDVLNAPIAAWTASVVHIPSFRRVAQSWTDVDAQVGLLLLLILLVIHLVVAVILW